MNRIAAVLGVWGALFFLLVVLVGCSSTEVHRFGDATVRTRNRFPGFDVKATPGRTHTIDLPAIHLSEVGERRFQIRDLTISVVPDQLVMLYPVFRSRSEPTYRRAWGNAKLRLQFRNDSGQVLFEHVVDFATAPFASDHARYDRPNFIYSLNAHVAPPTLAERLHGLHSYELRIVVEEPAREKGHHVRFRGEAGER